MTSITRRDILAGAATLTLTRAAFAKASQPSTAVSFAVPPNACDCHTHIFGDPKKFPFYAQRVYTPEPALPDEMSALHRVLHMERVVIVTPSIYGTDNSATLYGMKARGATARGVAVIDEKTSDGDLDAMGRAGIRGIRINLATVGQTDPAIGRRRLQASIDRMKRRNWHIQMYTSPGLRGSGRAGASGQGVRENFGCVSFVHQSARLSRCRTVRQGADRGQRGSHPVGQRLAASQLESAARPQRHRSDAGVPGR
jgi:hypothetical protein